jgi:hypothetical protein
MKVTLPNLALFKRSLLLDNRQIVPYIFRLILVIMVLIFLQQAESSYNSGFMTTAVGLDFFGAVTYLLHWLGSASFHRQLPRRKRIARWGCWLWPESVH